MSWQTEAVPAPAGFWAMVRGRDTETMAIEIFSEVDNLQPLVVPRVEPFQDPHALRRWQEGASIDEKLVPSFASWLRQTHARTVAIGENERRLRSTMWAQWRLRGTDYEQHFAAFHRERWGIDNVCMEGGAREEQVQARARHGVI